MLLLTSTSDLVRVVTSAAGAIEVHASWVDNASGTLTPGRTNTASITTATTTTIVGSPGSSTQRSVRHINIFNNHASVSNTVTVEHTDGTNVETLFETTLAPNESIILGENGIWVYYDAAGKPYVGLGPIATQAEMEAGTSTTAVVTPGRQHFHPSAAKFWVQITGAGTPVIGVSYNMTSIADAGVGRNTITIANDFSSANWVCVTASFTSTTTGDEGIPNINSKAAGTCEVGNRIITPAFADPNVGTDTVGYGDL